MRTAVLSAVAVGILIATTAVSGQKVQDQTTYPDTRYVSGRQGLNQEVKGELVIEEQQIVFRQKGGPALFAIPMTSVLGVSNRVETNPGSFGRRALIGVFASHREEFLTVSAQTGTGTETLIFKVKKNTSDDMVGKVRLYQRKAATH